MLVFQGFRPLRSLFLAETLLAKCYYFDKMRNKTAQDLMKLNETISCLSGTRVCARTDVQRLVLYIDLT
jgi:hypothetical protein